MNTTPIDRRDLVDMFVKEDKGKAVFHGECIYQEALHIPTGIFDLMTSREIDLT